MIKKILFSILLALVFCLSGCAGSELLNPNGVVELSAGALTYRSTKNVNAKITIPADVMLENGLTIPAGTVIDIQTDAAAGIAAREGAAANDAANLGKALSLIPAVPTLKQ